MGLMVDEAARERTWEGEMKSDEWTAKYNIILGYRCKFDGNSHYVDYY